MEDVETSDNVELEEDRRLANKELEDEEIEDEIDELEKLGVKELEPETDNTGTGIST